MRDQPKSIVYIRPDTIGDLVIFTSALAQLLGTFPDARHTLVVRPGYEALQPLFPRGIQWLVIPINPFNQQPGTAREALESAFSALDELSPDVVVAATLNRTWLEAAIATRYPAARRIALGRGAVDPLFANQLRLELNVDASAAFNEVVEIEHGQRDWEANHRLVDHLAGQPTPRSVPLLHVSPEALASAEQVLAELGLPARGFVAVFAGGLANVPIKAWPYSKFGALIKWIQEAKGLPALVMGHVAEEQQLIEVIEEAVRAGATRPALWLGRDGELGLLCGLLSQCRFYVGHDTGAMHIAAALRRPVVGIFGGGHWPRFRPVGENTVSVVQPLPCFGCNWDCRFGDAPCVKMIDTPDVVRAVDTLLAANAPLDVVIEANNVSAETMAFIAAVSPRYAKLQADRLERQYKIEELKQEADFKDREISELKRETDGKDQEMVALKASAEERKREMEAIKAELEAECAEKDSEIAELKAEATTKDQEIDALKVVCNEREQLIITQDGHIKNFQKMVAELGERASARENEASNLRAENERISAILEKLPPNAALWSRQFHDKDVHIRNLEAMLAARVREVAALSESLSNHAAGLSHLEAGKYYTKLLAEKEAAIQNLHRACQEREAVIQQLVHEKTGPLGWVHKTGLATSAHIKLKFIAPFREWLFKKVVEDYWMQIGVLRHYEPRAITWDRLPKAKATIESLPKIGVVTPSYGQGAYIESTMLSVLDQKYPKLLYVVQDGGSKDATPQIVEKHASKLFHWESVRDKGQADAIRRGFLHLESHLGPEDLMAWLNSDDFFAPRALQFVADYFARNPEVDVIYGHRIIIDGEDREIGRWIMPKHDPKTLEWIDYVPQETLFWRKRVWDRVGGIDSSFQFALDWDLLARFQQAKAKIVRVPYFLGCFRVHAEQKTSQHIHTIGNEEMIRIRSRFHGERHSDFDVINRYARKARFTGALTARLAQLGIRY